MCTRAYSIQHPFWIISTTQLPRSSRPRACCANGILAVEMEAAALYALAVAQQRDIICFAHVTNQMGQAAEDFEKGVAQGSHAALQVIGRTAQHWLHQRADQQRARERT